MQSDGPKVAFATMQPSVTLDGDVFPLDAFTLLPPISKHIDNSEEKSFDNDTTEQSMMLLNLNMTFHKIRDDIDVLYSTIEQCKRDRIEWECKQKQLNDKHERLRVQYTQEQEEWRLEVDAARLELGKKSKQIHALEHEVVHRFNISTVVCASNVLYICRNNSSSRLKCYSPVQRFKIQRLPNSVVH